MTTAQKRRSPQPDLRHGAAICGCIFLFALILRSGETAIVLVRRGLSLCAERVIPALFPFMVLSALFVECGAAELVGGFFARPMARIFGISGASSGAILLGALCGFPIGAKTAVALYDRGTIDRSELEWLMTFCNNIGPAFAVSAVGTALWSSPAFGVGLYWIQLGFAMLIGLLSRRRGKNAPSTPSPPPPKSLAESLTEAVSSSAVGMLTVCAYVVFFSALVGTLGLLLDRISPSAWLDALLFSLFELSSGTGAAASLADPYSGAVLTAFAVGWGGFSVHMQVMSTAAGRGVSFRPYLFVKAAQGLLCAAATAVWLKLAPPVNLCPAETTAAYLPLSQGYLRIVSICFAAALIFTPLRWLWRKNFGKIR